MAKIFINAGHGGDDPGAVGYVVEKDVNLKIAKACKDYLEKNGETVYMAQADLEDGSQSSNDVLDEIAKFNPDFAVDIHVNAGGGDGFECYIGISGLCKELAKNIEDEIKKIGQNSRGIKTRVGSDGKDYYYFIRCTSCAAIILEGAFVDNKEDASQIDSDAECKTFGEAYARGILKTVAPSKKPQTPDVPKEPEKPIENTDNVIYIVKPGDTLSGIADKYNTTVDTLVMLNGISDPNYIVVGDEIKIPTDVKPSTKPAPTTSSTNDSPEIFNADYRNGKRYTVDSNNGLNLRSGYGTDYSVICTLSDNTSVMWYGYYKVIDSIVWKKVKVIGGSYNGKVGYLSSQYLK